MLIVLIGRQKWHASMTFFWWRDHGSLSHLCVFFNWVFIKSEWRFWLIRLSVSLSLLFEMLPGRLVSSSKFRLALHRLSLPHSTFSFLFKFVFRCSLWLKFDVLLLFITFIFFFSNRGSSVSFLHASCGVKWSESRRITFSLPLDSKLEHGAISLGVRKPDFIPFFSRATSCVSHSYFLLKFASG